MTAEEAAAFLDSQRRAQFASINRDGTPHLVPVNYSLLEGRLAFWADEGSQKVANVRRDPRVTCLVEDGRQISDYRAVQLRGTAEVVDDQDVVQRVGEGFFRHFPPDAIPEAVREATRELGRLRAAVVVTAERVVSWDHTKVPEIRPDDIGR